MYIFKTTKHIKVLGFALNFVDMTAKINPIKVKLVLEKIENSLDYKKPITRQLVAIIGLCVSLFPVLPLGKLHCWKLKKQKTKRLKLNQENFNSKPDTFNTLKVQELHWWLQQILKVFKHINEQIIDFIIYADEVSGEPLMDAS